MEEEFENDEIDGGNEEGEEGNGGGSGNEWSLMQHVKR